jgi:hypothetical protein
MGDKFDFKSYRGICFLNLTYKVFANILCDRLLQHANAAGQNYQAGFQSGKSTTDQLFALRQILEKCNAITIVTCCVKIQNVCSESFETRQGLRQGDVLSTLIFNVVLGFIVRRANPQTTYTIYNKETQLLAYADDIDIVGRSQSAVRNAYLALEREAAKVGLKINEQKTKYMIAARNDITIRDVGHTVAIGDKHFEVVKECMYLGSLMTPANEVSLEVQRRIQTANRCFFGLRKHLQSSHLSRQIKFTIHKTLIRPFLSYGSGTWMLTKREKNQLLVFERKVLRTICGPKIENVVCRRRYNHKLDKE